MAQAAAAQSTDLMVLDQAAVMLSRLANRLTNANRVEESLTAERTASHDRSDVGGGPRQPPVPLPCEGMAPISPPPA